MKSSLVEFFRPWVLVAIIAIGVCQGLCPSDFIKRGTNCYKKLTYLHTHVQAKSECIRRSAALIPVTEEDVVSMVKEHYSDDTWYWTGGSYDEGGSPIGWVWNDAGQNSIEKVAMGTNFNMKKHHESLLLSKEGGKCVKFKNGDNITAADCTLQLNYLCSYFHSRRICPPGYDNSGSRCLSTGQYKHTHEEAKDICQNRYGQLYEPRNLLDVGTIYSFTNLHGWLYDQRVGIIYKDNAWRFESDGVEIPADMWSDNYPLMQHDKTCGMYSATTKKLINVACTDPHYYMCIYQSKPHCPAGFHSFGWSSECFMIAPYKLDFVSSLSYCKQWGAGIATLREDYTKGRMHNFQYNKQVPSTTMKLWVDVNDKTVSDKFQFSDGSLLRGFELSSTADGDCFYLNDTRIYAAACNNPDINPLCMAKQGDCPMGFVKRGDDCYRFSDAPRYQYKAVTYCGYYSSLLSWTRDQRVLIDGLSEEGYRPARGFPESYWVGAKLDSALGKWAFPDNQDKLFLPDSPEMSELWSTGNPVAGQDCILMNSTGYFKTQPCGSGYFRFICQATEGLHGMDVPMHDLQILQPTCFKEDPSDPQFKISPGMYDPGDLSLTMCQSRCRLIGFNYAGAIFGKYCFCSNVLTLEAVDASNCNQICIDATSGETCGSSDGQYITVIRVGVDESGGKALISDAVLTVTPAEVNVGGTVTFKTSLGTGKGSYYRMRFGEGDGFSLGTEAAFTDATPPVAIEVSITHIYHHPGNYVATVMYYDKEGLIPPVYESVEFRVTKSAPSPVKLDCPVVVEPSEIFYCHATIFHGSSLDITVTRGDGSPAEKFFIPEPRVKLMGVAAPQRVMEDMKETALNSPDPPPAAVLMPWTRLEDDSVLLAFSAYVSTPGDITFME